MSLRTLPSNVTMSATHDAASAGNLNPTPPGAKQGATWKSTKNPTNVIKVYADGAIWDTVLNAFVLPEDTNVGKAV